jgi:ubiquinone/menaquinone biosynthesis C-methylase UbiE
VSSSASGHKAVVQEEFTRQADAYAAAPLIVDPARLSRLVHAVAPTPDARLLEVATGPGHVALAFAPYCREVVGLDLTEAPLVIAERTRLERGLSNTRFQTGDAEQLPFERGGFDVVVCRFAYHHFEDPPLVLGEMSRACRAGGTVAVEDIIVSEHPERAAYHNRFENLRDQSHTRAFPLSRLLQIFAASGLEVERVSTDSYEMPVEGWLASAQTPPERAAETRGMIERDAREDLSGTTPLRRAGELFFIHHTATVIGRKLSGARGAGAGYGDAS